MYSDVGSNDNNNEGEVVHDLKGSSTDTVSDDVVSEVRKEPYRIHCNPNH